MTDAGRKVSRREVLIAGAGLAGTAAALTHGALPALAGGGAPGQGQGQLPVKQIESIMETSGTVMNGVLTVELDRNDLHVTGPGGIPFKAPFEVDHEFHFQSLGDDRAIINAEMALLPSELNPVIDRIFSHSLIFMAEHQHFFDLTPQMFHIHFRGVGHPLDLARAAIAVVRATGTPLPQSMPSNPKTPLDKEGLARILGGTAMVGGDGVVTVSIPRAEQILLGGIVLKPEMGVSVTVAFEPLGNGRTACAPDYALIASEINPALALARAEGFAIHCLYNQETAEFPQLYFSHNLATGNAEDLANRVARVLTRMNVMRM